MGKKVFNWIFLILFAAIVIANLVRMIAAPVEINEYENRYAETVQPISAEGYLDGTFQDSVEAALGDQMFLAEEAKESYNTAVSSYTGAAFRRVLQTSEQNEVTEPTAETTDGLPAETAQSTSESENESQQEEMISETSEQKPAAEAETAENTAVKTEPETEEAESTEQPEETESKETEPATVPDPDGTYYTLASGMMLYEDHLMYRNRFLAEEKEQLDLWLDAVNPFIDAHPEKTVYMFYCEKETDVNFVTGERSGIYEYLRMYVHLPAAQTGCFRVWNFSDFDDNYFRTDHHWRYKGSYQGYVTLLSMLQPDAEPLQPTGEYAIGKFAGSKTRKSDTASYSEMFYAYDFDYPDYTVHENGVRVSHYGNQKYDIEQGIATGGTLSGFTYGSFYGQDSGEVIIENAASENGSILVLGESYDNAILNLLAAHYTTLYSIDLRNYYAQIGRSFHIEDYLTEHPDISTILMIGNLDYFVSDTLRLQ